MCRRVRNSAVIFFLLCSVTVAVCERWTALRRKAAANVGKWKPINWSAWEQPIFSSASLSSEACALSDVDIFMVMQKTDLIFLGALFRSLHTFMPCRGHMHILIDTVDAAAIITHLPDRCTLYPFPTPAALQHIPGYELQTLIYLQADSYATKSKYVMMLDADSLLTMPVTCTSLFDDQGRLVFPHWKQTEDQRFKRTCDFILGQNCTHNYMSFLPITVPTSSFRGLRSFISRTWNGAGLDEVFASWWTVRRDPIFTRKARKATFSQFVVLGNYIINMEANRVLEIDVVEPGRRTFVHIGIHFGWRYCGLVGRCITGGAQKYPLQGSLHSAQARKETRKRGVSKKFSAELWLDLEQVVMHGMCFMRGLKQQALPPGCAGWTERVDVENLVFQHAQPNIAELKRRFQPDRLPSCPNRRADIEGT